jgi:hypothetical protein
MSSITKTRRDRLLAALIARLPVAAQWPRADRIAWLQMMAMAFDVVYGPCSGICVTLGEAHSGNGCQVASETSAGRIERGAPSPAAPGAMKRFYVDRDGFAMGDGRPIAMEDLPTDAILWDERVGLECGDAAAILWRDVGTVRRSLPPGVTLRPVFDES